MFYQWVVITEQPDISNDGPIYLYWLHEPCGGILDIFDGARMDTLIQCVETHVCDYREAERRGLI